MTPSEVLTVLIAAKAVDDRVIPDEARAAAWGAILNPAMTLDVARRALLHHYASSTDTLMPAHLNRAWADHLRYLAEEERRAERDRELAEPPAPMPDEVRDLLRKLQARNGERP
jgi:hypothetical protein